MSVFPQQSCCSCLAYTTACVGVSCCLSALFDGTTGCRYQPTGPSVSHTNEGITLAGPAVFAPVFMCVYEKVCVHECSQITQICQQSSLLNLKHTLCSGLTQTRPLFVFLFFLLPSHTTVSSFFHSLISFYFLVFLHVFYLLPFLLVTSCQPHLFSCSLVTPPCSPPSLTPQLGSTMRWQWQCSGVCACVFLCDVTLQQLYSRALFFNPCAHRPHCYFQIL